MQTDQKAQLPNVAPPAVRPATTVPAKNKQIKPKETTTQQQKKTTKSRTFICRRLTKLEQRLFSSEPDASSIASTPSPYLGAAPASASPLSSTTMTANRPKQPLPSDYQYISIINTHQTDLVVLSRPKSNPQTTTIQFFSSKSLGTGESLAKRDVPISDVLDLAWFSPLDTFALLTLDTIYLYNLKSNTEKARERLAEPTGQSVAWTDQYLACKTKSAIFFYSSDLSKRLNTWRRSTMELEEFHSLDLQRTFLGLCGRTKCRFYQILSGDRCEPLLLYDIPRGGTSLSILLVSKSLNEVKFIIADKETNRVHIYSNDILSESADVDRPIRCCGAKKLVKTTGQLSVLAGEPDRIEGLTITKIDDCHEANSRESSLA